MSTPLYRSEELAAELLDRTEEVADRTRERLELARRLAPYRDRMETSTREGLPTLHVDDISAIPFVDDVPGVEEYPHRARLRARGGDGLVVTTDPAPGYEDYNREYLGLAESRWFVGGGADEPLAVARAGCAEPTFREILDWAEDRGVVRLEPFMASEPIWAFAAALEEHGVETVVRGPPPPVHWIANDKLQVARLTDELFDGERYIEPIVASEPDAMVDALFELADEYRRVAIKRTRCASAMGNVVFESRRLEADGRDRIRRRVVEFLRHTRWPEGRHVLVVPWYDVEISPSTQCWVPPEGEGEPYVEGVFEQILEGDESIFAGSRPTRLPEPQHWRAVETSLALLEVFQQIGYSGRCSFDFIVTDEPELRLVECNGRWGGTSLPMQFVDRLVEGERPAYRAQDWVEPALTGESFAAVVEACEPELFRPDRQEGRFVFYNVGPLEEHGKFDVISIGETQAEAERGLDEVLPRLLDRID